MPSLEVQQPESLFEKAEGPSSSLEIIDTMYSIDEVVHAAAIITASFPTLAPELLPHHRQELQFAFESLGGVLRSTSSPTDTSQLHNSSLEGTSSLSHHNSPKSHNIQNRQRATEIEDTATEDRPQQNHREHSI